MTEKRQDAFLRQLFESDMRSDEEFTDAIQESIKEFIDRNWPKGRRAAARTPTSISERPVGFEEDSSAAGQKMQILETDVDDGLSIAARYQHADEGSSRQGREIAGEVTPTVSGSTVQGPVGDQTPRK